MLVDPSVEELLPKAECRYSLCMLVAKRARQLINGEEAAVPSYGKKALSVAIEELYKGKVKIVNEDEEEIPAAQDEETLTTE